MVPAFPVLLVPTKILKVESHASGARAIKTLPLWEQEMLLNVMVCYLVVCACSILKWNLLIVMYSFKSILWRFWHKFSFDFRCMLCICKYDWITTFSDNVQIRALLGIHRWLDMSHVRLARWENISQNWSQTSASHALSTKPQAAWSQQVLRTVMVNVKIDHSLNSKAHLRLTHQSCFWLLHFCILNS